jgi:hypothetical protein
MPVNRSIQINCKWEHCHWNIGKSTHNNCARVAVHITDHDCCEFIDKETAKERLEAAVKREETPKK